MKLTKIKTESKHPYWYVQCVLPNIIVHEQISCRCSSVVQAIYMINILIIQYKLFYREGSVRVFYDLKFKGDMDRLKIDIPSILELNTQKVPGKDYEVLMLKQFIVDIRDRVGIKPTTSGPINPEGINLYCL